MWIFLKVLTSLEKLRQAKTIQNNNNNNKEVEKITKLSEILFPEMFQQNHKKKKMVRGERGQWGR